jgi:hypothetical protein
MIKSSYVTWRKKPLLDEAYRTTGNLHRLKLTYLSNYDETVL